jgi:DDE superfamily endonuclease
MLPLVDIPDIVQHYAPFFAAVLSPQALQPFQRYLSGLMLSENKTVEGITRLLVLDTRHQSSLNPLLTKSPFDIKALHQAQLALMPSLPGTQMKPKGVLSVDDTLLSHYGQHFDQIAYLYDSAQKRYVWAHNFVNLHDSDDLTDYPVDFRRWQPAELDAIETGLLASGICIRPSKYDLKESAPQKGRQYLLGLWQRHQHKPEVGKLYQSKLILAQPLIYDCVAPHPQAQLPVTFDHW